MENVPVTTPPVHSENDVIATSKTATQATESAVVEQDSAVPDVPVDSDVLSRSQSKDLSQTRWDLSLWKFVDATQPLPRSDRNDHCINIDIIVDVIIPVHNASLTIRETIASAMNQVWLRDVSSSSKPNISVHVCCYDDASTDDSWLILQELHETYSAKQQYQQSTVSCSSGSKNYSNSSTETGNAIPTQLWISRSQPDSAARGPGYARNRAVQMRDTIIIPQSTQSTDTPIEQHFICWLDSDDIIHPARIYYQVHTMMQLKPAERLKTLLGTNFDRFITTETDISTCDKEDDIPANDTITPHYTKWANELSHERLYLERFRELTIIQPTWMMCRHRYTHVLHGYLECPHKMESNQEPASIHRPGKSNKLNGIDNDITDVSSTSLHAPCNEESFSEWIRNVSSMHKPNDNNSVVKPWRLVHAEVETGTTIRVAEDLRFFHEHLYSDGLLRRTIVTRTPLVSYRHRPGISQSALTSRKLLLALRVAAFEQMILFNTHLGTNNAWTDKFIIWGAGRDGKDFFKALSPEARQRVYCFADVDDTKIARGFYNYFSPTCSGITKKQRTSLNIPVIHFSLAARDLSQRSRLYNSWKMNIDILLDDRCAHPYYGRIVKNQEMNADAANATTQLPQSKRIKVAQNSSVEKIDPGTKSIDVSLLPNLPVVVCVAMYRTNGALENNVKLIDRVEGTDLWYFS